MKVVYLPEETVMTEFFAYWEIYMLILLPADFFFKINFRKTFRNAIRVSNSLNPDYAGHIVWPDLGSKLFAKAFNISR